MEDRGLGLELEKEYGETVERENYKPLFWCDVESMNFKLNDEPITKSGSSRMVQRARAGVIKPTGSIQLDSDLERLGYFIRLFLDQYKYTPGNDNTNIHEFWGGEEKELPSARFKLVFDMLIKYVNGVLCDGLKLESSDDSVSCSADFIYKNEMADIIGENDVDFERPDDLDHDIFLMFYDLNLTLNNKPLNGVDGGIASSFSFEGKNNLNVDKTVGLGSRAPQRRALAQLREISLSITTSLTRDTVHSILAAEYGEIGALEPSACKILQVPLELDIRLCEDRNSYAKIIFPKCTLACEYDLSGADEVEVTLNLTTLGSSKVTLADGSEISTDMYVKLVNYQDEIAPKEPEPEPLDTHSITVNVKEEDNENPIGNCPVKLDNVVKGNTNNDGVLVISNVDDGLHSIKVSPDGYIEKTEFVTVSGADTNVTILCDIEDTHEENKLSVINVVNADNTIIEENITTETTVNIVGDLLTMDNQFIRNKSIEVYQVHGENNELTLIDTATTLGSRVSELYDDNWILENVNLPQPDSSIRIMAKFNGDNRFKPNQSTVKTINHEITAPEE